TVSFLDSSSSGSCWYALAVLVLGYIVVALLSTRSPIAILATSITLDSQTGFYRLLIWEHGFQNVLAHPLIGIGLADWARPHWMASGTIDSFWLVTAMRTGIPSVLILITALMTLVYAVNVRGIKNRSALVRNLARGWLFSLIALCFIATTVHFWNVSQAFFFFVGLAGCFADPRPRRKKKRSAQQQHRAPMSHPVEYGYGTAPAI
ncbi:MAG: hypothetical protein K0U34_01065, partial [Alphaproteobacteria bacterium]|nr:hypothetical protein [Alphaproteobacteria bacterium]